MTEFLLPFLNEKKLDKLGRLEQLHELQQLWQLQQLERVQQLQTLERLKGIPQLYVSSKSYDEIQLKEDSIIYCDIPYLGTADYGNQFDHKKFFNWADSCDQPVFISEYNISDKRVKLVKQIAKRVNLNGDGEQKIAQEKIYVNDAGYRLLLSLRR